MPKADGTILIAASMVIRCYRDQADSYGFVRLVLFFKVFPHLCLSFPRPELFLDLSASMLTRLKGREKT